MQISIIGWIGLATMRPRKRSTITLQNMTFQSLDQLIDAGGGNNFKETYRLAFIDILVKH